MKALPDSEAGELKRRDKANISPGTGPPPITPEAAIRGQRERLETYQELFALLRKIVCIVLALWIVFSFIFGISVVHGEGMYPRLRDGDLTVWFRLEHSYNIGDVIAFTADGERQYGRIVALGGDTVDFSKDGLLMVNGSAQQEEVFFATAKEGHSQKFPMVLGRREVFVLGDNRSYAHDSRDFGTVSISAIQGKIISLLRRRGI